MINLDVVTRYYVFVTCRYNEIYKLHKHSNDARVTGHFTIHVGTMSIGKHSDTELLQSQDCILLWTADVELWSTVWTKGIKLCDPHTSVDRTRRRRQPTSCLAGYPHRRQLEQGGCWLGKVQIKQLGRRLMWPLWLWDGIEARVAVLFVCVAVPSRRQAIYSGSIEMTALEIIIAVLHWPLCVHETVAVNSVSVCAGEQHTCEMCICLPYCPTSCQCISEKRH